MNKFSQQLQNRLNAMPGIKELLSSASTHRLRKDYRFSLKQQWQFPETTMLYVAACGVLGMFSAVFMLSNDVKSPVIWGAWAAVLVSSGLWWLKFGRGVLKAGHEWHEKAASLGLGGYHLNAEFEEASYTLKLEAIEACTKLGATSAQIQQLYAIAKDCDLPKQWWWELKRCSEEYPKNEIHQKQKEVEQQQVVEREMLSRLKIQAHTNSH